jgi:NADP-dependent 3-hydroxy acid dehydrogenase YdfG
VNAHVRETLVTREFTLIGVVVLWCEIPRETPMSIQLKPLHQQVIVNTGASSGIGLCTALLTAERGVNVVLATRSGSTLEAIAARINETGGGAVAVPTDVGDRVQMEAPADAALARFGRIDTWVNDAGVAICGKLEEVSEADSRRLFDANFWV